METQNVVFTNAKLDLRLSGLLRLPNDFDLSNDYAAIIVDGSMLSLKEQVQSTYAEKLTDLGYVTLVFDHATLGKSEGTPRQQELPSIKESDIEAAVDFLQSLPFVDNGRIGGLGICGGGSYMSVAGVKEPRLKAVAAVVPAIANIATSPMAGFFMPAEEAQANKEAYEKSGDESVIKYLNFMPRNFDEGAAYYYTSRGMHPAYNNKAVAWSQLELIDYNVTDIMKDMRKPYLVISGENAWSKPASTELFDAVPGDDKEMRVIPEAGHFDLYDLAPYVPEAFSYIQPFFAKNL